MADSADFSSSTDQILPSDLELIDSFILGKKKSIATAHLQIEYSTNTVKLIDEQKKVVGVSKQVNEWQQKILLTRHTVYFGVIQEKLLSGGFFAIADSGHPDFAEFHKYQTPKGFRLCYDQATILGKSWLGTYSRSDRKSSTSILIFQNNNWYPIQELNIYQQTMRLQTLVGSVVVGTEDLMVWIEQMSTVPQPEESAALAAKTDNSPVIPSQPNPAKMSSISEDSIKSTELTAVFKTPVVTSGHQSDNERLESLKNGIRIRALAKLVDYLDDGEKIISTEVLKNGHDQVISTKITEIKRKCPRWVIEQIKRF